MQTSKSQPRWAVHAASLLALCATQGAFAAIGDLDPTFGSAGRVTISSNAGPHVFELPDGRVLIAGRAWPASDGVPLFATNRYLPDGTPDRRYGVGGRATAELPRGSSFRVDAAALQQDGKLAFAGSYWTANVGAGPYASRVDESGALDPTFAGGMSIPGDGTEPYYSAMLVMPGGEILAAISDWTSDRIDRYGTDGRFLGSLTGRIAPDQLALQRDGRLIVSGYHREMHKSVVMRIDAAGQLDRTFGTSGYAVVSFDLDHSLAVDPLSDRILICNWHGISRLTRDGQPDTTFGPSGSGQVTFGSDGVPGVRLCAGLIPMLDGGIAYIATRADPTGGGVDQVLVGGLTESGAADTRFGADSGAHTIDLGPISATVDYWNRPSRFVTRDGNALLTWQNSTSNTLQLARLDLGGEAAYADPPTSSGPNPPQPPDDAPPPPPPPPPSPDPITHSSGGGGSNDAVNLALLGLIALSAVGRRRLSAASGSRPVARPPKDPRASRCRRAGRARSRRSCAGSAA